MSTEAVSVMLYDCLHVADAHFYVGEGEVTGGNTIVADENGRYDVRPETVALKLLSKQHCIRQNTIFTQCN